MTEENLLKRTRKKLEDILSLGRAIEDKIKELDLKGNDLLSSEVKDDFLAFAEELDALQEDSVRLGSKRMFKTIKKLAKANAKVISQGQTMESYIKFAMRRATLEMRWLEAFKRFEQQADAFYEFCVSSEKTSIFSPNMAKRAALASRRIAVGIGMLAKRHRDIDSDFIEIDKFIPADEDEDEEYDQEFQERRQQYIQSIGD